MKSEPDRLDFLIVVLPILLFGLLGFQAYEYIQMDRQRAGALPVSSEGSPAAADEREPESPESESGDAATELPTAPTPDAQPGDAGVGDTEAQSVDTVTADPGATDSPGGSPVPAAGEPAADADQALDEGEPAADPALDEGEPAAADTDRAPAIAGAEPAAEALPPMAARTEAPVAEPPAALEEIVRTEILLEPQTNPAKVGEVFAVDVIIREASEAFGAIFHLRYDTRLLQLNEDPRWELGPFFEDPEGGTRFNAAPLVSGKVVVSIMLAHASEGRSGDGRLATFYFQALAPGETRLDLIQSALRDRLNRPLAAVFTNATLLIVE